MAIEYGCLDCIGYGHHRTFTVKDEYEALFCPYCGNRSLIETGDEWDEIVERDRE